MKRILATACLSIFVTLAPGLPVSLAADSSARVAEAAAKLKAGNRALRAGDMQEALTAYEEAATIDPANDAAIYNQAVVRYRSGELAKAAELFQRVAVSENTTIAASARFNLGNTAYAQALRSLEQDPRHAAEELKRAISSFREGLSLNPGDEDARTNIELAAKLLHQLQSQQQQQQDEAGQEDEQQRSPDSPQQPGDENQKEEDGGKGDNDRQPMDEGSEEKSQQESEPSQQPSDSDDAEGSDDEDPPGEQPPPEDASPPADSDQPPDQSGQDDGTSPPADASQSEDPSDEQSGRQDRSQEETEPKQSGQPAPDDSSTEQDSAGQLAAANEDTGEAGESQIDEAALQGSTTMTVEEAQKMLQAIRDRDMLRRFRRQQMDRSRRIPVEKDW